MNLEKNVSNARKRKRKTTEIPMHVRGYKLIRNDQNSRGEQRTPRQ
jgi:hypothetical protein